MVTSTNRPVQQQQPIVVSAPTTPIQQIKSPTLQQSPQTQQQTQVTTPKVVPPIVKGLTIRGQDGAASIIRQTTPVVAGKQLLVKQGGNIIQKAGGVQQVVTLVKTSTGMTLATLPKGSLVLSKAPGTVLPQQAKNTIVKILPSTPANKVLTTLKTIPSNMIQINKATGKLILLKGAAGQIPTLGNQQVLVVSSNAGLKNIQNYPN